MFKDFSLLIKVTYKIKLEPMNTIHTWIVPFLGERLFKPKKKNDHPVSFKGHNVLGVLEFSF